MSKIEISDPANFRHVAHAKAVGETENLTELENLNEDTLLMELKARYNKDTIYTYVGEILVAVNPFKSIDNLYNDAMARKFVNSGDRSQNVPHIFAVADAAFQNIASNGPNQVCVISGESGAGKTESAKLFMKQIIYLSQRLSTSGGEGENMQDGLENKIIQLNPLLEAFGNAQTLMNDNSSRFGKYVELRFNSQLSVQGAIMSEYLLEKSRVVFQGEGERNFHVFYLFFAGLNDETREKYQLADPGEHRIINDNEDAIADINSKKSIEMWKELEECFKTVGFTDEEYDDLFHLLSGVLLIGDVEFAGDEESYIVSGDDALMKASVQLGVDPEATKTALTQFVTNLKGEIIERHYRVDGSEDCRDAMIKALYGRAFSWIVKRVNLLLGPKSKKPQPGDKSIAILDIFGFECFDSNSFEQLLINLANEQLQFFFNDHIFKMELDEYAREGIDGSKISYEDNQPLLDMLLSKPIGLLAMCDEEALFPKGSDATMLEKFHQSLGGYKAYEKPRGNEPLFTINHYAGKVTYESDGFLEKNRDTLAVDVIAAMRLSERPLIKLLFEGESDAKDAKKKKNARKAGRDGGSMKKRLRQSMKVAHKQQAKTKRTTVGAQFKTSLAELIKNMSVCAPHFVRCVKPNLQKAAHNFNEELVTKQLRYTGMLETTRIRKEGYSHRPTFKDFVDRYRVIAFPFSANPAPNAASCRKICDKAGIDGWQVGKTKVFLRYFHADALFQALIPFPTAAIKMQKVARGFYARLKHQARVRAAEREANEVDNMIRKMERYIVDTHEVVLAMCDEDNMRPADYFTKKSEPSKDKLMRKFTKKAGSKARKPGGVSRAASVRWFKEVEMKKGAGIDKEQGGFQEWFHGIITRKQAEGLLVDTAPGTFLVRVSESRFGYSLSHKVTDGGRIKHYMIDQTPDGQYQVVGNSKLFASLNSLVSFHKQHRVVSSDPVPLIGACGQQHGEDDREEFVDKKTKKLLG